MKSYDLLKKNKVYKDVFKVTQIENNKQEIIVNVFRVFSTEDSNTFIELQMSLREDQKKDEIQFEIFRKKLINKIIHKIQQIK